MQLLPSHFAWDIGGHRENENRQPSDPQTSPRGVDAKTSICQGVPNGSVQTFNVVKQNSVYSVAKDRKGEKLVEWYSNTQAKV